jgi:hypothetical protein
MEELDNRREYVGTTLVYSDRWGPKEFWRGGTEVSCICNPSMGLLYKCHGDKLPPPTRHYLNTGETS